MAIDLSIYANLLRPPRSVAEYDAQAQAVQQNALGLQQGRQNALLAQMKMQDYTRGIERQGQAENALAQIYAQQSDPLARARAMQDNPLLAERGAAAEKAYYENQYQANRGRKEGADADKVSYETRRQRNDTAIRDIAAFTNHDEALQSIQRNVQAGDIDPGQAQQIVAQLQAQPDFRQWQVGMLKNLLTAKERLELEAPKVDYKNTGGALTPVQTNAYAVGPTGAVPLPITMAPGEAQRIDIARMTAAAASRQAGAAEEANRIQRDQQAQLRQLQIDEGQSKAADRVTAKAAAVSSIEKQIGVIDKAMNHPGKAAATGLSGALDPRNYLPGTEPRDFQVVLDQIKGSAFLQAFQSLKGGGAITEIEGKKAEAAIARLDRAQSDREFDIALQDLRDVMTTGYERAAGKKYQAPKPKFNMPADPNAGAWKIERAN